MTHICRHLQYSTYVWAPAVGDTNTCGRWHACKYLQYIIWGIALCYRYKHCNTQALKCIQVRQLYDTTEVINLDDLEPVEIPAKRARTYDIMVDQSRLLRWCNKKLALLPSQVSIVIGLGVKCTVMCVSWLQCGTTGYKFLLILCSWDVKQLI